jgi:hypothetical protein
VVNHYLNRFVNGYNIKNQIKEDQIFTLLIFFYLALLNWAVDLCSTKECFFEKSPQGQAVSACTEALRFPQAVREASSALKRLRGLPCPVLLQESRAFRTNQQRAKINNKL